MLENGKSKIEDIKRRLYDREDTTTNRYKESPIHKISHEVSDSWKEDDTLKNDPTNSKMTKIPMSIFKKFFLISVLFFICAIGFAYYMFSSGTGSVSNDNIDITVVGNAFTKGGDNLPLQVEIVNRNNANLELANLIVEYPKGADNNPNNLIRLPRDQIGTIEPGQSVTRNVNVSLFGEDNSVRNVKISLEYHPEGSNAIFTKEKEYFVTISSAPLELLLEGPDEATTDQFVSFKITATLNTSLPDAPTMLQVKYPNGFVFDSATPGPLFNNSVWDLSTLSTSHPVEISIKGKFIGQSGDQQVFHVYAGATSAANHAVVSTVYNSLLKTVTLTKPFLEAKILVNNQNDESPTSASGETIHGQISWVNNLSTRITDAQIILNMSGNALDKSSIDALEGFYNSANSQIIWDRNTIPDLAEIEPGQTGTVAFTMKSVSLVGLGNSIKEPEIVLDVSIKGRQPSVGSLFDDVNNFAKKTIKIVSDFQIASSAVFGSGSLPPKAETETQYVVTWTLSNSVNAVSGAVARSSLPIYIKWVGPTSTGENITYNDVTREVVWNIGSVKPNTGFDSNREVSFILSLNPSLSQVGSVPQLMKEILLSGKDTFSGTIINSKRNPITTLLTNDSQFKSGDERVVN